MPIGTKGTHQAEFDRLKACVILPTYNNSRTLAKVIEGIALYSSNIIVVNDGSTDGTELILKNFPWICTISYEKNRGKGWAIRKGFAMARQLGYQWAITMDSDGQHFASDLPAFLQELEPAGLTLLVGARNMNQSSVPGKSSFGNRFSNFWFRLETGIRLPDTQSGFRLYPLQELEALKFHTRRYEFEIEVLVRAAWKGIRVGAVPVQVYYPPAGERVSHFRPFADFLRISLLNSLLVLIAVFCIWPRHLIRKLPRWKEISNYLGEHLIRAHGSDRVKALSVAFGVFMGILPIWGFQLVSAIFLSFVLRLNKALVIIAANISIPPMIPLIIFSSYKMGSVWMKEGGTSLPFSWDLSLQTIKLNLQQYIYGSITLAVASGLVLGALSYAVIKLAKKKPKPGQ